MIFAGFTGEVMTRWSAPGQYNLPNIEISKLILVPSEGELWSNRANNLMFSLLEHRYPALCDVTSLQAVESLLYTPGALNLHHDPEMEQRLAGLSQEELETGAGLTEAERGRLLCLLTSKMMTDLPGSHCVPLPTAKFSLPSSLHWMSKCSLQISTTTTAPDSRYKLRVKLDLLSNHVSVHSQNLAHNMNGINIIIIHTLFVSIPPCLPSR